MNKFLCILIMLFPLCVHAQDYEAKGDAACCDGNYEEAIIQYNAAIAMLDSRKVDPNSPEYLFLQKKLVNAKNCLPLKETAMKLFNLAEENKTEVAYEAAKNAFQKLLQRNSQDNFARRKVVACDKGIQKIATNKADEELWAQAVQLDTKDAYRSYLNDFPAGIHASEAKTMILDIEEKELWLAAKSEGTEEAFNQYIASTITSEYVSQAKYEICRIHDDSKWEAIKDGKDEAGLIAYINDTTNICKQHSSQANAYLSIIKVKRLQASGQENAKQIVQLLSQAQKEVVLDSNTKKILEDQQAVIDYESFIENPTIESGEYYLARYSSSIYRERVSDMIAQMYANGFTYTSTSDDFTKAMTYAISRESREYVKDMFNMVNKKRKAAKRQAAWEDRWQFGIGMDFDTGKSFAYGPRLELRIGAVEDIFNFSLGAKYIMWNPGEPDNEGGKDIYRPKVGVDQVPVFAVLKFNLTDLGNANICKLYLAAEGSYNFNLEARFKAPDLTGYWASLEESGYYPGLWKGEKVFDSAIVHPNNITTGCRVGFNWRKYDLSIYGKYDVTPMFDTEYISTVPGYSYEVIEPIVKSRFRFGFSLIYYIII